MTGLASRPHDEITFGLAALGYLTLSLDAALSASRRRWPWLTRLTAVVVAAHVGCIWWLRSDWSLQRLLDKGIGPFVLFHGAFALVLGNALLREPWRTRGVVAAFAVVSLGAVAAPFRYAELAVLRAPIAATFVLASGWSLRGWWRSRSSHA